MRGKVKRVGVRIPEGTKIPMNCDLSVHDVEKAIMACRACDHYLWKSLNLLKRVLEADGKNLKGGGFDSLWGEVCEKALSVRPCSHSSNHKIKMLCHTVHMYTNMLPGWCRHIS